MDNRDVLIEWLIFHTSLDENELNQALKIDKLSALIEGEQYIQILKGMEEYKKNLKQHIEQRDKNKVVVEWVGNIEDWINDKEGK